MSSLQGRDNGVTLFEDTKDNSKHHRKPLVMGLNRLKPIGGVPSSSEAKPLKPSKEKRTIKKCSTKSNSSFTNITMKSIPSALLCKNWSP